MAATPEGLRARLDAAVAGARERQWLCACVCLSCAGGGSEELRPLTGCRGVQWHQEWDDELCTLNVVPAVDFERLAGVARELADALAEHYSEETNSS